VGPGTPFTVADYQRLAVPAIDAISDRGRLAVLQGGTGLYLRALLDGWNLAEAAPDPALRAALEQRAEEEGIEALDRELRRIDPAAAELAQRNPRRLIRALEIHAVTGRRPSEAREANPPDWATSVLGLDVPLAVLDQRIEERVAMMLNQGWLEEVARVNHDFPSVDWRRLGHGYPEMAAHLAGRMTLEEAAQSTIRQVRQYARRQYTWFRADRRVQWIPPDLDVAVSRLSAGIMGSKAI
jgi:tRNA dimethylallyltransferase